MVDAYATLILAAKFASVCPRALARLGRVRLNFGVKFGGIKEKVHKVFVAAALLASEKYPEAARMPQWDKHRKLWEKEIFRP